MRTVRVRSSLPVMQGLQTRLTVEFGIRYPFVGAGMGFVAHERLAAAVTNAGGLGFLGASPDPPESLSAMVRCLHQLTSGPFGVDLICATLPQGPASTDEHIQRCIDLGVELVAFHHELPPKRWVDLLAAAGTRVWQQASSVELARAAVALGVHGIVAQGVEAGGHCQSTVPVLELVRQIRREHPELIVLAAGGIVHGRQVAAALDAGADGVWVGTRLIASEEANAHLEYKRRLVESDGATLVTTAYGPEWPDQAYRVLPTRTVQEWAGREDLIPSPAPAPRVIGHTRLFPHSVDLEYEMPKFSAVVPTPPTTGDWEEMAFPAGQGVGQIREIRPAAAIVKEMMAQALTFV
jgi:nitronate monooxygenase